MAEVERIDVEISRRDVSGGRALLVCAYDDREKCRKMKLEGAIDMDELRARLPSLPKDQEIILYCA